MTERRRPGRLASGDCLAVVAPSSPVPEFSLAKRGFAKLSELGFELDFAPHMAESRGYLAGSDADRADDLLWALGHPRAKGIICLRGGYGAMRTVLALDHDAVRGLSSAPPKVFLGFSDITVLHAYLARELGWVTFYGPVVTSLGLGSTSYTLEALLKAVMEPAPFAVEPNPDDPFVDTLVGGRADGVLDGGCLTLLASLVGTPWQPDFSGKIVFFEDVDEEPYGIDGCLTQLLGAGALRGCAGIVIGEHANCRPRGGNSLGLEEVFSDLLTPLGVPTIYNLPIGHGRHIATLPLGVSARLDADRPRLELTSPAVT